MPNKPFSNQKASSPKHVFHSVTAAPERHTYIMIDATKKQTF